MFCPGKFDLALCIEIVLTIMQLTNVPIWLVQTCL
jgi:hypothetical protein